MRQVEYVRCPLCGGNDYRVLSVQDDVYGVVRCRVCGLCYLNPRPTREQITAIYKKEYYFDHKVGYSDYLGTYARFRELYRQIFQERLEAISRFKQSGRILEVGCAYGLLLDFFREHGWEAYGIEISSESASYARDVLGLEVQVGPLESGRFPADFFDVILMLDVIEHLPDLRSAFKVVRQALKPDGILVAQVPFELFHWEKILLAILAGKKPGSIEPDAVPAHLYFFSPRTLRLILKKFGFEVIRRESGNYGRIRERIFPPSTESRYLIGRAAKTVYYRWGVRRALRWLAPKLKQGSGIILYARKRR